MSDAEAIRQTARRQLAEWIESCTVKKKIARSTVAVGIVVLDHLRAQCPVTPDQVLSTGGELKGARSKLGKLLTAYGLPMSYLKEVTTRQGAPYGRRLLESLQWGHVFAGLSENERDQLLLELIDSLAQIAQQHLLQETIKLRVDRRQSPSSWIQRLLDGASQRSGGVVEQHLVGAKLARRFPGFSIPNYPAHAGDRQTSRSGDFSVVRLVFHVTASPSLGVIDKCADNLRAGLLPVLVTLRAMTVNAQALARERGLEDAITVLSIEDFLAMNVIEIATSEGKEFVDVLREIIAIYNQRLVEVETNLSLQIQLS